MHAWLFRRPLYTVHSSPPRGCSLGLHPPLITPEPPFSCPSSALPPLPTHRTVAPPPKSPTPHPLSPLPPTTRLSPVSPLATIPFPLIFYCTAAPPSRKRTAGVPRSLTVGPQPRLGTAPRAGQSHRSNDAGSPRHRAMAPEAGRQTARLGRGARRGTRGGQLAPRETSVSPMQSRYALCCRRSMEG